MKSEAGHFIVETVELRAAFAASSARSLKKTLGYGPDLYCVEWDVIYNLY